MFVVERFCFLILVRLFVFCHFMFAMACLHDGIQNLDWYWQLTNKEHLIVFSVLASDTAVQIFVLKEGGEDMYRQEVYTHCPAPCLYQFRLYSSTQSVDEVQNLHSYLLLMTIYLCKFHRAEIKCQQQSHLIQWLYFLLQLCVIALEFSPC